MDFFRTMAILGLTVGIPTRIGLWLRSRMREGSPAGGVVVVACFLVGLVIGTIVLHYDDAARDRAARDRAIDSVTKAICTSTDTDPTTQAMRELSCSPDTRKAVLRGDHISISIAVHGELCGVILPHVPDGATDVVWLLDGSGAVVGKLPVEPAKGLSFLRAPGIARAASVELTAEPSPGAAPTGAVLARTTL